MDTIINLIILNKHNDTIKVWLFKVLSDWWNKRLWSDFVWDQRSYVVMIILFYINRVWLIIWKIIHSSKRDQLISLQLSLLNTVYIINNIHVPVRITIYKLQKRLSLWSSQKHNNRFANGVLFSWIELNCD